MSLGQTKIPKKYVKLLASMSRKQRRDWVKANKDLLKKEIKNEADSR